MYLKLHRTGLGGANELKLKGRQNQMEATCQMNTCTSIYKIKYESKKIKKKTECYKYLYYKKKKTNKEEMSLSTCTLKYRKKSIWELKKQQDMYNYTLRGNLRDKITETE